MYAFAVFRERSCAMDTRHDTCNVHRIVFLSDLLIAYHVANSGYRQKTVDLAQDKCNLDVIYGDTDSIMINTRCTDLAETKRIGNQVSR